MKKFLSLVLLCSVFMGFSQKKLITKSGMVTFEASVPNFEEVKAKNESATFTLNTSANEISGLILIKGFRFKMALMEEHFNDKYLESDSYPKATFKGKIEDFDITKLSTTAQDFTINGKIKIHGKTEKVTVIASIKKMSDGLKITSDFVLDTDDFNIAIPDVVSKKVSKKVFVKLAATLQ